MEFEVCVDSLQGALLADKYGADRIELCSAFYEGGLTPSAGLVEACVKHSNQEVFAMIRPEAGGFQYADDMIEVMKIDIIKMAELGAKGVVFGVLNYQNQIDYDLNKVLVDLAKKHGLKTVFHRAFDFCENPLKALEQIIALGFDRILTSGQASKAIDGLELIKQMVAKADGRIEIMAGSGVNASNAQTFIDAGVNAIHFSGIKTKEKLDLSMGVKYEADEAKIASVLKLKA